MRIGFFPAGQAFILFLALLGFALPLESQGCPAMAKLPPDKPRGVEPTRRTTAIRAFMGDPRIARIQNIQWAIVRIDNAIENRRIDDALGVDLDIKWVSRKEGFSGISLEKLWDLVEFAQLRIVAAKDRITLLRELHGNQAYSEKQGALLKLIEAEQVEMATQAQILGEYYDPYLRVAKHLDLIRSDSKCENAAVCNAGAQALLLSMGARSWRMHAKKGEVDGDFEDELDALDIPASARPEEKKLYFTKAMDTAVRSQVPEAVDTKSNKVAKTDGAEVMDLIDKLIPQPAPPAVVVPKIGDYGVTNLDLLFGDAKYPQVSRLIVNTRDAAELDRQWREALKRFSRDGFVQDLLSGLIRKGIPGGQILVDNPITRWLGKAQRDSKLNRMFGFDLTTLNRTSDLEIPDVIQRLRDLGGHGGSTGRTQLEAVLESVARRTDLHEMWESIVAEVAGPRGASTVPVKLEPPPKTDPVPPPAAEPVLTLAAAPDQEANAELPTPERLPAAVAAPAPEDVVAGPVEMQPASSSEGVPDIGSLIDFSSGGLHSPPPPPQKSLLGFSWKRGNETPRDRRYADVFDIVKALDARKQARKLDPLSPTYRASPWDVWIRIGGLGALGTFGAYHKGPQAMHWIQSHLGM